MKIAVIVPFFQREQGLLARAVTSVIRQQVDGSTQIDIIIIDDGSPWPASAELIPNLPAHVCLRIVVKPNGGVGSARNAGLRAVTSDTRYVSFLDSDDVWEALHLSSALACLRQGADFYFDNNFIDEGRDAFGQSAYMKHAYGRIDPSTPEFLWLTGKECFEAVLHECLPHTSQVVFDFDRHNRVRFETDLKRAGEDQIFFLDLAVRSHAVAICTQVLGRRGHGVSIYRESLAWDSPHGFNRLADQMIMRKRIGSKFALTEQHRKTLKSDARKTCDHFVFLSIRNARRQPNALASALLRLTREHPTFWTMVPGSLANIASYRRRLREAAGASP